MRSFVLGATLFLIAAGGCDGSPDARHPTADQGVRTITPPSSGPYVSVAVDNYFHDVHPVDHKEIAAHRPLVVRNEGRNLHNVTIQGTEISHDVAPGKSFVIRPVGEVGPPGTYKILCKYHADQGMTGEITVIEG